MVVFFKKRTILDSDFFDKFVTKLTKDHLQNNSRTIRKATRQEHKEHKNHKSR